jgi:hypothetical protein
VGERSSGEPVSMDTPLLAPLRGDSKRGDSKRDGAPPSPHELTGFTLSAPSCIRWGRAVRDELVAVAAAAAERTREDEID